MKRLLLFGLAVLSLQAQVVTNPNHKEFIWPNSTAAQAITITATTTGNLGVMAFNRSASGITVTGVTGGGTWARAKNSNTNNSVDVYYTVFTSSVTSITVTASTGNTANSAKVWEFASTTGWNASPLGVTSAQPNASSTTVSMAAITPAENNDLVLAAVGWGGGRALSASPGAPWTNLTQASATKDAATWQQQGTAASISTSWTLAVADTSEAVMIAFIPTSGTPSTFNAIRALMGVGK